MTAENRKQRLRRLDLMFVRSPIYFVTACMQDRGKLLATVAVHESFLQFGQEGPAHGAWIGAYVIMPDHLHLFVATDDEKITLPAWAKSLKNTISKALRARTVAPPHSQKNIFRSRAAERRVVLRKMEPCSRESITGGACQKCGRLAVHGGDLFVGVSLGIIRFGGHRPPLQKQS